VESLDDEHVRIATEKATANVNFYELDPGATEIVELNIVPADDPDNPTFFLHFEMDDLDHAKQLFDELTETLSQLTVQRTTRILLSCTSGLTTSFFAQKLAEIAATLSLDYEFEAKPIVQALEVAGEYEAVMLAPQVHMRRDELLGKGWTTEGALDPRAGLPHVLHYRGGSRGNLCGCRPAARHGRACGRARALASRGHRPRAGARARLPRARAGGGVRPLRERPAQGWY
jgi:hypothetical protein